MYVIMVYDIGEKRVGKIPPIVRKYLHHVQKSVFEGDITPASFERLKGEIKSRVDVEVDQVRFYVFRSKDAFKTEVIGVDTSPTTII